MTSAEIALAPSKHCYDEMCDRKVTHTMYIFCDPFHMLCHVNSDSSLVVNFVMNIVTGSKPTSSLSKRHHKRPAFHLKRALCQHAHLVQDAQFLETWYQPTRLSYRLCVCVCVCVCVCGLGGGGGGGVHGQLYFPVMNPG